MDKQNEILSSICHTVIHEGATALRALRLNRRHTRLAEPEIFTPEDAELQDLNRLVWSVVEEAIPICQALGVRLTLAQDPRLPTVPLLVRPFEDMLAAALDLCLDECTFDVHIKTYMERNRAVVTIERRSCNAAAIDAEWEESSWDQQLFQWLDLGPTGRAELLCGDRAMRAVGGKLSIQRRAEDLRFRLELPSIDQQDQVRPIAHIEARLPPLGKRGYLFPGSEGYPLSS